VKFGFIAKHRGIWPAEWLCEAFGVSRGRLLCVADTAAQQAKP
jgi:putative transposase